MRASSNTGHDGPDLDPAAAANDDDGAGGRGQRIRGRRARQGDAGRDVIIVGPLGQGHRRELADGGGAAIGGSLKR